MRLTFAGASREVTGSCYWVETESANFLVDCGLFQGSRVSEDKNEQAFPFDPQKLDFVLLTHAHLDHCGRLPVLYKRGFKGKIYAVEPTVDLTMLILDDASGLILDEAEREGTEPLYEEKDAQAVGEHLVGCRYHHPYEHQGVTFEFFDAGHILGSAQIRIKAENKSIVFSGDLGNPPVPLLRPTEFIDTADYVVMESTYGNRRHEDFHLRQQRLVQAIKTSVAKDGILLIPSFAVERTQEILHDINQLVESGKMEFFPMFLDSPLAIKATEVYRQYTNYYNHEALKELTIDDNLFTFPGLRMTDSTKESKAINEIAPPKVIMAGSGMMHGGRILHHLRRYINNPNCTILIVGFMVKNTLGRRLLDGEKTIRIFGEEHKVGAHVEAIGAFSGHADQPKLLEWISHFNPAPKNVFVTHGEETAALDLAESIKSTTSLTTEVPHLFDHFDL